MRTCGAEKLPWLVVVEVEVDAERARCFAERQVRLGLVVDEAVPETRDRLGHACTFVMLRKLMTLNMSAKWRHQLEALSSPSYKSVRRPPHAKTPT